MKMWKWTAETLVLALLALAVETQAAGIYRLTTEEAARHGATHVYQLKSTDLTVSTANVLQTNTFAIAAKQSVAFVKYELKTTFRDTATTTVTNDSLLVFIGDGTDNDLYLSSTEMCEDGSEVYLKYGRGVFGNATTQKAVGAISWSTAAAVTNYAVTTKVMTNMTAHGYGAVTAVVAITKSTINVPTGVSTTLVTTVDASTTTLGEKVYTAADTVDIIIDPHASFACSAMDQGEALFYFRIEDSREK